MAYDVSPTARALPALEAIQNSPGITAQRLGERLGVTERAARRYVAILREAELPLESVSGPYGGYLVGRGLRLPPLTLAQLRSIQQSRGGQLEVRSVTLGRLSLGGRLPSIRSPSRQD